MAPSDGWRYRCEPMVRREERLLADCLPGKTSSDRLAADTLVDFVEWKASLGSVNCTRAKRSYKKQCAY